MLKGEVVLSRKKPLQPVQRICKECCQSVDDVSSTNGLTYLLCTKKIEYVSASKFACGEFRFSEQAKEKQKKYEIQEEEKKVQLAILLEEKKVQEFILNKNW